MTDKFKNLKTDKETKILFRSPMKFGDFDIVYEKWVWSGITAESIIFVSSEVEDLTNEELENEIRSSPLPEKDTKITISRNEFTFVNFNFKS